MTPAQLQALYLEAVQAGNADLANLYLQRIQQARQPEAMMRQPVQPQPFAPDFVADTAMRAQAAEQAEALTVQRLLTPEQRQAERAEEEQRALEVLQRERGRPVQPGAGAVRVPEDALPPFRPSRIISVPVYRRVPDQLRQQMTAEQIAAFETREPAAGANVQPLAVERFYRTDAGGLRPPTRGEAFTESFAQQQLLSEEAARRQAEAGQEQLEAALRGERLPPLSVTPAGAALSALTQRREQGAGVVETPLAATLRGVATVGSALAAELIGTGQALGAAPTQRAEAVPTAVDPEMRRRASTDPDFIDRVLENVSTGRGIGDEYYDTDFFRQTAGDIGAAVLGESYREAAELAPFYIGTAVDMTTPGYLGLTKGAVRAGVRAPGVRQAVAAGGRQLEGAARRTVARRMVEGTTLAPGIKQATIQAIRTSDGTEEGITAAVRQPLAALGDDAADSFRAELQTRTPADYVFVTESVAVPRGTSAQVRQAVQGEVQRAVQRSAGEQAEYLRTLAALAADTSEQAPARVAALAERSFPGQAGQRLRTSALTSAEQGTVDALRAAADALEAKPGTVAQRSALAALGRLEEQAGLQAGTLRGRLVQKAPREATLPQELAAAVRDVDGWAALPARTREEAFEALRSAAAARAAESAGVAARRAEDITALQAAIRADNPWVAAAQRVNDGQLARWVRAVSGERLPPASVARATEKIRGAAEGALRSAERRIVELARETGSTNRAYERFLSESTGSISGEERWRKVLTVLYGEEGLKRLQPRLQQLGDLDAVPVTVNALRAFNADAARAGLVPRLPLWSRPARRAILKTALDEGVRKRIIAEGIDLDAALTAPGGGVFGAPAAAPDLPRWATLAGGAQPVQRPVRGGVRTYDVAASRAEQKLAEGSEELVRYLENVAPAQRSSVLAMAADAGSYLFGAGRNALNNARYGFMGLPNLPYLLYRLTEAPILSMATIGAQRTLDALPQLGRAAKDAALRRLGVRRLGTGLTAADGTRYSQKQLDDLVQQYGIGIARTETQRIGQLADDMERAAQAAASGQAGAALDLTRSIFDPTVKGFYLRLAEAAEVSFRRAVFEGALAAGVGPSQAADLARRSLLDFGAQPEQLKVLGRFFATAQAQYGLLSELTIKAVQNPEAFGALTRGLLAKQKLRDPYNLDGDAGLTRLGIVRGGEERFYGPQNPLFLPVEQALSTIRHGNLLLSDLREAARTFEEQPGAGALEAGEAFSEAGVRLLTATLPAIGALIELSSIEDGQPVPLGAATSAERLFWQSAIAARAADPDGSAGIWQSWLDLARPDIVQPPAGAGHPVLSDYWLRQPPAGTPHILYATDEQGRPLYMVLKPSARGLQNLELVRAATPDVLERAFGATAALIDAPAGQRLPGASVGLEQPPLQVFGEGVAPTGAAAAAGLLFGQPAGPADPAAARRLQIEQLRQTREGQ